MPHSANALRARRWRPLHAGARCAHSVEELLRSLLVSAHAREGGRGWARLSGTQVLTKWSQRGTVTQGAGAPARADRPAGGCGAKAERRRLEAAARAAASAHAPHASVAASCSESAIRTFGHHVHVAHGPEQLPTVRSRRDRQGQQRRCPCRELRRERRRLRPRRERRRGRSSIQLSPLVPRHCHRAAHRNYGTGACSQPPGNTQRDTSVKREGKEGHRRAAVMIGAAVEVGCCMTMVVVGGCQSAPPSSRNSQVRGHHFQGSVPDQFTQHRLFRHRLQDNRKNFGRCP